MCKDPPRECLEPPPSRPEPELGDNFSCPVALQGTSSRAPLGEGLHTPGSSHAPTDWEACSTLRRAQKRPFPGTACGASRGLGSSSGAPTGPSTGPSTGTSVDGLLGAMDVKGSQDGSESKPRPREGMPAEAEVGGSGVSGEAAAAAAAVEASGILSPRFGEGLLSPPFDLADVIGKANMKSLMDIPLGEHRKTQWGLHGLDPLEGDGMPRGLSGVLSTGQMSWENILMDEERKQLATPRQQEQEHHVPQQGRHDHIGRAHHQDTPEDKPGVLGSGVAGTQPSAAKALFQEQQQQQQQQQQHALAKALKEEKVDPGESGHPHHETGDADVDHGHGVHDVSESAAGTVVHAPPKRKSGVSNTLLRAGKAGQDRPASGATGHGSASLLLAAASAAGSASMTPISKNLPAKRKSAGGEGHVGSAEAGGEGGDEGAGAGDGGRGDVVAGAGGGRGAGAGGGASAPPATQSKTEKHSKVETARGWRDRRVRLSSHVAVAFYDVQDRLGLGNASQALEWLLEQAAPSIERLPRPSHHTGAAGLLGHTAGRPAGSRGLEAPRVGLGHSRVPGGLREATGSGRLVPPLPSGAHGLHGPSGEHGGAAAAGHVAAFHMATVSTESSSPGMRRLMGVGVASSERYSTLGGGSYLEASGLGHHRTEGHWGLPGTLGGGAGAGTLGMQRPGWPEGPDYLYGLGGRESGLGRHFRVTPEVGDVDVGVWEGEGGALGAASGRESSAPAASEGDASWLVGDTDWKGLEGQGGFGGPGAAAGAGAGAAAGAGAGAGGPSQALLPWESRPPLVYGPGGRAPYHEGTGTGDVSLTGPSSSVTPAVAHAAGGVASAPAAPAASSSHCNQGASSRPGGGPAYSSRMPSEPYGMELPPAADSTRGRDFGGVPRQQGAFSGAAGGGPHGAGDGRRRGGASERALIPWDWPEEGADDPAAAVGDADNLPGFWYGRSGSDIALFHLPDEPGQKRGGVAGTSAGPGAGAGAGSGAGVGTGAGGGSGAGAGARASEVGGGQLAGGGVPESGMGAGEQTSGQGPGGVAGAGAGPRPGSAGGAGGEEGQGTAAGVQGPGGEAAAARARRVDQAAAASAAASAVAAARAAAAAAAAASAGAHHWAAQQPVPGWQGPPGSAYGIHRGMPDPYAYPYGHSLAPGLYQGYPPHPDMPGMPPAGSMRPWGAPHMVYPGAYPPRPPLQAGPNPFYPPAAYMDPYLAQHYGGPGSWPAYQERTREMQMQEGGREGGALDTQPEEEPPAQDAPREGAKQLE